MMELYEYKEFLNFDDIADYLADKNIKNLDIYTDKDNRKLSNLLKQLIRQSDLTAWFYYSGEGFICSDSRENLRDYFIVLADEPMPQGIGFWFRCLINDFIWCSNELLGDIIQAESPSIEHIHPFYITHKKDYQKDTKFMCMIDNPLKITFNDLFYLKADIDKFFNINPVETEIHNLKSQLEQLRLKNGELKDQIAKLERTGEPAQSDTPKDDSFYDWQSMDKHSYPPELHLAMQVWQGLNSYNFSNSHSDFSTRFNIIAKQLGIPQGKLFERIKTTLTPLVSKTQSQTLINSLIGIPTISTEKLDD